MSDSNASVEADGNGIPSSKRKVWPIALLGVVLTVMAIPAILCGSRVLNVITCYRYPAPARRYPVDAKPLLELELPEESFPILWPYSLWDQGRFENRVITGVDVRVGGSETITQTRSVFDYYCRGNDPVTDLFDYDPSRFSYGGDGDRRYCASHILVKSSTSVDSPLVCSTPSYRSYAVVQNGRILIVLIESTDDKQPRGLGTNLAIQTMAEDLLASPEEINEMDAKSRLVWEIVNFGAHDRDLRGSDLSNSDLTNVGFWRTDLRDSNLTGAQLTGAKMGLVKLEGAIYDQRTSWPAGFDPEAAGAILVETD